MIYISIIDYLSIYFIKINNKHTFVIEYILIRPILNKSSEFFYTKPNELELSKIKFQC